MKTESKTPYEPDQALLSAGAQAMSYYMVERHGIYRKRKAGIPGPWTHDPILAENRFCNVYRELDTVTIWIDQNIRKPFGGHRYLWLMLAIARYINWPETLQYLLDTPGAWPKYSTWEPKNLTAALESLAATGKKVYTGAYMIRAESNPNAEWFSWSKHRYIAEIVIGRLWEDRESWGSFLDYRVGNTLQSTWARFQDKRYIGWGPFMAYEVVTDMRHTRYLDHAQDIYSWANAGPGAIRGLNRIMGRDLQAKPKPEDTNREMVMLMNRLNLIRTDEMNELFGVPKQGSPRFEMRDIEHGLCELDKYLRVKSGDGKMRAKYDWKKASKLPD